MKTFSNDTDILRYEPALFGPLAPPHQVIAKGTAAAILDGVFTDDQADFIAADVTTGGVLYLRSQDGKLEGAFEIVSVNSPTQLTVSIVRADGDTQPIAPADADQLTWHIATFRPQAVETSLLIAEFYKLAPAYPDNSLSIEDITDSEPLRLASTCMVIAIAYAMLADSGKDDKAVEKSLHYKKQFTRHIERCTAGFDTDGDGAPEARLKGTAFKLKRK